MKRLESLLEIEVGSTGNEATFVALSQRFGSIYAVSTNDGTISVFSVGSSEPLMAFQGSKTGDKLLSMNFDDSEALLMAIYASGEVYIWDLESEVLVRRWRIRGECKAASFHPLGFVVAILQTTQIELWDLSKRALIHVYPLAESYRPASTILFSPDGLSLVCGATDGSKASTLIFDLARGTIAHTLTDASDPHASILSLAFHPEDALLMTGSTSGKVTFWDFEKLCEISSTRISEISSSVNASPTSATTAKGSSSSVASNTLSAASAHLPVHQVTWSNDGTCALALTLNEVYVWNTASRNAIQVVNTLSCEGTLDLARLTFGFDSFVIVTRCTDTTLTTLFYNLQNIGLCQAKCSTQMPDIVISETSKIENEAEPVEDELLLSQITTNKALHTLRNRLDHLKSLRASLVGKSSPTIWQAISKLASAARPELLGELLCGRIIEAALNITPSTVGPNGLATQTSEDLTHFLSILKPSLRFMSESHQNAALDYLQQLVNDLIDICPEKFDVIADELDSLASAIDNPLSIKAKAIASKLTS